VAFATRVFRCAEKQHRRSEGSFTNAVVLFNCTFPLYPERVGVPLSDSSGTPRVGGLHALWQDTPESLHPGSSAGSVEVEIQGHKRMRGKPIETLRTQWNMLLQWSEPGDK
jgi:hypothetical protein